MKLEFKPSDFDDILPAHDYDGAANPVLAAVVERANETIEKWADTHMEGFRNIVALHLARILEEARKTLETK